MKKKIDKKKDEGSKEAVEGGAQDASEQASEDAGREEEILSKCKRKPLKNGNRFFQDDHCSIPEWHVEDQG
ncbi:hypothetical protein L1887_38778 [Cichorium endivia]|nr:hypothetical protein L1887_38778 [Cichorium endivia]